jgi:hypothetical protein
MMTAAAFRRDRWLRTSASHLGTWSVASLVLDSVIRSTGRTGSMRSATFVAIAGITLLNSMTTERRVAKMVGVAGEPVYAAAGAMWRLVLAMLALASVALVAAHAAAAVIPLWLAGVGATFLFWGRKTELAWYAALGAAMVIAGVADAWLSRSSGPVGPLRVAVLGLALPAAAIATNRRFLWVRAPG